ncbi:WSC domain-containing protein [Podospora didyma]|uniref:WSC domain-containing protein n=1 Tax=Podospora didyma TaxID=330526 RepID=A0AAE0U6Z6_9PEZI|nr:WSC domain-containing protein [Podospora didyma]
MERLLTLVAFSAAFSGLGVNGSPHNPAFRRRAVAQIPGYDFAGCYTEATGMRALTGSSFFDDLMTVNKCAVACAGFAYFGVEYGRECYCGASPNQGSVLTELSECSFPCPGDSTQNCGAGNRLDMYKQSAAPPPPATPTSYAYRGCYAEPAGSRALPGKFLGSNDMTVAKCGTFCASSGYTFFGLEYYTECYCGYAVASNALPAPEADCKFPCAGNHDDTCGGDWRLNVYEFGAASPSSTSSSASTAPTPTPPPANYISQGCYTEATGIRALSGTAFFDDLMTVAKCAAVCSSYTYFGLEYGRECYCGNQLNQGSVSTAISECSFNCPGKPSEKCGAGSRLNFSGG